MMFSDVIADLTFPRRSPVFSQSCSEVSVSLSDVGGVAIGAIDLKTASCLFFFVFGVCL